MTFPIRLVFKKPSNLTTTLSALPDSQKPDRETMLLAYLDALIDADAGVGEHQDEVADELHGMILGDHPKDADDSLRTLAANPNLQHLAAGVKSPVSGRVIRSNKAFYDPVNHKIVYRNSPAGGAAVAAPAVGGAPAASSPATGKRATQSAAAVKVAEIGSRIAAFNKGDGFPVPESDYRELLEHLPNLKKDDLVSLRNNLAASFGKGAATKEKMANALRKDIEGKITQGAAETASGAPARKSVYKGPSLFDETESTGGLFAPDDKEEPAATGKEADTDWFGGGKKVPSAPKPPEVKAPEPKTEPKPPEITAEVKSVDSGAASPADVRNTIRESYDYMKKFKEFRDGVVEMRRLWYDAKERQPNLTVPEFHAQLQEMNKNHEIELRQLNEVGEAKDPELAIHENDSSGSPRMFYYVRFKNSAGAGVPTDKEPADKQATPDFGEPSADRHDAIHKELKAIYKDPGFKNGDRNIMAIADRLSAELEHHRPAAIKRAQDEIDAEKAKKAKEATPAPKPPADGGGPAAFTDDDWQDVSDLAGDGPWSRDDKAGPKVSKHPNPHVHLANVIAEKLANGEKLDAKDLWHAADEAHGGTRASGKYGPSDAYDSLEAGFNKSLVGETDPSVGLEEAKKQVESIKAKIDQLPTQTNRSGNKDDMQQFSTPPHYAYAVAWIANIQPGENVLEPSAGTACIAVQAENAGGIVYANELDERRAEFLKDLFGDDHVHISDAEQISGILPKRGVPAPTVVVMNPPFSQTAGRMGDKKVLLTGANHIKEAMRMLAPGGRLVAIVGEGMSPERPTYKPFFDEMAEKYDFRANIGVSGAEYKKYGTQFGNRVLVFDKVNPSGRELVVGDATDIPDLLTKMEGVRNERPTASSTGSDASLPAGGGTPQKNEGSPRPDGKPDVGTDPSVAGSGSGSGGGVSGRPEGMPVADVGTQSDISEAVPEQPDAVRPDVGEGTGAGGGDPQSPFAGTPQPNAKQKRKRGSKAAGKQSGKQPEPVGPELRPPERLKVENRPAATSLEDESGGLYTPYRPAKMHIEGMQPHRTPLVESSAMAAIQPPDPTYQPVISPDLVEKGIVSDALLENLVYFGQAHSTMLPANPGQPPMRRAAMSGDGTGSGKTRQFLTCMWDNTNQGRKKHLIVTKSDDLLPQFKDEMRKIGWTPDLLHLFDYESMLNGTAPEEGICLIPYTKLRSGPDSPDKPRNVDAVAKWLGSDFDGVIAFDESHLMANSMDKDPLAGDGVAGMRGQSGGASQQAEAGMSLLRKSPNARVLFASATGASKLQNLAYCADRLGLSGPGSGFIDKEDFMREMNQGGVAALEAVAQSLKARGVYSSRNLSYKGVTSGSVKHELTPEQRYNYDKLSEGWRIVFNNINEALKITGGEKNGLAVSRAMSAFQSAQQNFFNQVITSMMVPSLIKQVQADIDAGMSPVIQVYNTLGQQTEKEIKSRKAEDGYDDIDLSPRKILSNFIDSAFPTNRHEEYVDENGNVRSRPVMDYSNGRKLWADFMAELKSKPNLTEEEENAIRRKHGVTTDRKKPLEMIAQDFVAKYGEHVKDPEAEAKKAALLQEIESFSIPALAIDQLLHHFGHDNVAEVTGRNMRLVPDDEGRAVPHKMGGGFSTSEGKAFQSGKKKILIFSLKKGGTGFDFHADKDAGNSLRRSHHLLQLGWKADDAVQGFGRTNRTNQTVPPHYWNYECPEIPGQKRFSEIVKARLEALMSLSRGSRKTGKDVLSDGVDINSPQGMQALETFKRRILNGEYEDLKKAEFQNLFAIRTDDDNPDKGDDKLKELNMNQFLNRLLAVPLAKQADVFNKYADILGQVITEARSNGTLGVGTEDFEEDVVDTVSDKVLQKDKESGAESRHLVVKTQRKNTPNTWDAISKLINKRESPLTKPAPGKSQQPQFARNNQSGKLWAVSSWTPKTDPETGTIIERVALTSPTSQQIIHKDELTTKFTPPESPLDVIKAEWDSEVAKVPEFTEREQHFVTGDFLPIWKKIPTSVGSMPRIFRLNVKGKNIVGRHIPPSKVDEFLRNMGMGGKGPINHEDVHKNLEEGSVTAKLSNGWTLRPVRFGHERRIELIGPSAFHWGDLVQKGVIKEKAGGYAVRLFVPTGEGGADVLKRIVADHKIVDQIPIKSTSTTLSGQPEPMARPAIRLVFDRRR